MKNYFFTLILFFSIGFIVAQEEDGVSNGATFIQVDYIKTVPGKNYGQILNEKWAKLAEKRIKEGTIVGWDAWWNMNSTDESNHDILLVTLLTDVDSIGAGAGIRRAFPEMTDDEVAEFSKKNREARKIVNTTIYKVVDNYFKQDSVPKIALTNYMKVTHGDEFDYEEMEKEYKQTVEASAKAGWALHKRVDRFGSGLNNNYMTVDFYNKMSEMMDERAPTFEMSKEQREKHDEIQKLRRHVYSDTHWNFISLR